MMIAFTRRQHRLLFTVVSTFEAERQETMAGSLEEADLHYDTGYLLWCYELPRSTRRCTRRNETAGRRARSSRLASGSPTRGISSRARPTQWLGCWMSVCSWRFPRRIGTPPEGSISPGQRGSGRKPSLSGCPLPAGITATRGVPATRSGGRVHDCDAGSCESAFSRALLHEPQGHHGVLRRAGNRFDTVGIVRVRV